MSRGQVLHLNRQGAEDAKRARAAQHERAIALVREHFDLPCLKGTVDGWAVMAVLNLWREHGEGNVKLGQVRSERQRLIRRQPTVAAWFRQNANAKVATA